MSGFGSRLATMVLFLALAGCTSQAGYHEAMSDKTALNGNSRTFQAPPEQAFSSAKIVLVQRGFTIEHADPGTGLIKATRNLQDSQDPDVSYNIVASVDITPTSSTKEATVITAAASQQTVLHREWHTWWHLLWILPLIPTGTEYQTVVTKEGNITEPAMYNDLFAGIDADLKARGGGPSLQAAPAADPIAAKPLAPGAAAEAKAEGK